MREEYLASEAICRTEAMNACLSNFEPESRSRSMLVDNVIALFYWEEFLATKLETELESSTVSNLHTRLKVATEKALELIGDDSDGFKYEVPYWDEEKLSSFLKNKNKVSRKQE